MKKLHFKRKKSIQQVIADDVHKEVVEVKREWHHLLKFKDENRLLFMSFIVLIAAVLIVNTLYVIDSSGPNKFSVNQVAQPDSAKILTSLQTGLNDAMSVRISNVTENSTVDKAFTIDPSETMLILDIAITNMTVVPQQLIPVNQMYVRTDEGDTIALHVSSYVKKPLIATELASGKTATGQLSFNVKKDIARPLLYVDTGWGKNVPLVFDVLH